MRTSILPSLESSCLPGFAAALCPAYSSPKVRCGLCQELCPEGAVRVSLRHFELLEHCTGCGLCSAICPNGVFWASQAERGAIQKAMRRASNRLTISCSRAEPGRLRVRCLHLLSTELILLPATVEHVKEIIFIKGNCQLCGRAETEEVFRRWFEFAAAILSGAERSCRLTLQQSSHRSEELDRRGFLSGLFTAALPSICPKHPGENLRRAQLVAVAKKLRLRDAQLRTGQFPIGSIRIAESCIACGVCARLCPQRAIRSELEDGEFKLSFAPALCTGCRLCLEICLKDSISLSEDFNLSSLAEDRHRAIYNCEVKECRSCRSVLPQGVQQCLYCSGKP